MRIEVDTKQDSREELSALADMLQRLSRSSGSGAVVPKPASRNIFEDPSPGVGIMNMFGDSPQPSQPQQSSSSSYDSSSSPSHPPDGGLFSLFNDSTAASQPSQALSYSQPATVESSGKKSTAQDILDDDRIQLY